MADQAMKPNPGYLPDDAIGKKVIVELVNGTVHGPWAADGKGGCVWTLRDGYSHDIRLYRVAS